MMFKSLIKGVIVQIGFLSAIQIALSSAALGLSSGEQVISQLQAQYRPTLELGYRKARDELYTYVDNHGDHLTCLYTGEEGYLSSHSGQPRQDVCDIGFNTEHIYPQSKGARGDAKSDLHHLFAVHRNPNSARGNLPFGEIDDGESSDWYCGTSPQRFVPDSPDACSHGNRFLFEPRVDVRGVVARAMFYFYTIHRAAADRADPHYFPSQQTLLCQWHRDHPVTDEEIERSHRVAKVQGNENPFVLHPELADQIYCANVY